MFSDGGYRKSFNFGAGDGCQVYVVRDGVFSKDCCQVGLHDWFADVKPARDFFVGDAIGDETDDFSFLTGQALAAVKLAALHSSHLPPMHWLAARLAFFLFFPSCLRASLGAACQAAFCFPLPAAPFIFRTPGDIVADYRIYPLRRLPPVKGLQDSRKHV